MLAYSTGIGTEHAATNQKIAEQLSQAVQQVNPGPQGSNVIGQRKVYGEVDNGYYDGYCTDGAARIGSQFFPYIGKDIQEVHRRGNAT